MFAECKEDLKKLLKKKKEDMRGLKTNNNIKRSRFKY